LLVVTVRVARSSPHQQHPVSLQQPASRSGSFAWADRSMNGRASAGFEALMMALIIPSAIAVYGIAYMFSRRAGVPLDKAFAEIPPE